MRLDAQRTFFWTPTTVSLILRRSVRGSAPPHAALRLELTDRDLTEYMAMLLTDLGCTFVTDAKKKIVRDIKERLTYVALDIEAAMVKSDEDLEKTYELQDGNVSIVASVHLSPL